jgi:hypothetical protein
MRLIDINKLTCFLHKIGWSCKIRCCGLLLSTFLMMGIPVLAQTPGADSLRLERGHTPEIKQMVPAILGLSMTALLMDEPVNDFLQNNQSDFLDQLAVVTDVGGEKTIVVPAVLLSYGAVRFIFKNERLESTSLKAMQSVLV